ncbi:hypothetical protein [Vibrio phage 29Fa.3]|nr:hypothetical protein [Vibrio phage 29Fa.3]WKC56042.1 hypothetical protein [Vibrio phage CAU_VPP01]
MSENKQAVPRIMLNPQTGIQILCIGNRKFKAGESHRFNKATTEKHLRRRVPVGNKSVPTFIPVEDPEDLPVGTEQAHGQVDLMDQTDKPLLDEGDGNIEVE